MECETGIWDADECNDAPNERVPDGCSGVLILSDKPSKCGSSCLPNVNHGSRRQRRDASDEIGEVVLDSVKNYTAWTLWHS